jgi:hypothetical protein
LEPVRLALEANAERMLTFVAKDEEDEPGTQSQGV